MVSICGLICVALKSGAVTPLSDAEQQPYVDAFVRIQQQTQSYQAELHQTVRLRGLKKPVESTGRILYRAPGSLRLAFTKPAGEYMLITGDDIYVKKSNRPLSHRKTDSQNARPDQNARLLLLLFQGRVHDWLEFFTATVAREDDDLIVTLRSKQADVKVEIENIVALPSYDIRSIQIRFDKDNSLTYEFFNPVRNAPVADNLFEISEFDRKL